MSCTGDAELVLLRLSSIRIWRHRIPSNPDSAFHDSMHRLHRFLPTRLFSLSAFLFWWMLRPPSPPLCTVLLPACMAPVTRPAHPQGAVAEVEPPAAEGGSCREGAPPASHSPLQHALWQHPEVRRPLPDPHPHTEGARHPDRPPGPHSPAGLSASSHGCIRCRRATAGGSVCCRFAGTNMDDRRSRCWRLMDHIQRAVGAAVGLVLDPSRPTKRRHPGDDGSPGSERSGGA